MFSGSISRRGNSGTERAPRILRAHWPDNAVVMDLSEHNSHRSGAFYPVSDKVRWAGTGVRAFTDISNTKPANGILLESVETSHLFEGIHSL